MRQPLDWTRILVEGAVIVGSILLAFGIDAWWEGIGEARAERALLERVRAEFVENRALIERAERMHRVGEAASLQLLELATPGEVMRADPAVDSMVAIVFLSSWTFNPGMGAVDLFLNTESSLLVRNQELADLLVAWPGRVEEFVEEERELLRGATDRWTPYRASRVSLAPFVASGAWGVPGAPPGIMERHPRSPLVVDELFLNILHERLMWEQFALFEIGRLLDAVDETLASVEEELER